MTAHTWQQRSQPGSPPPSLDELLSRFGAISHYRSIDFWSTMHQAWEPFVKKVTDGPSANFTSADLKPQDFVAGPSSSRFKRM